ncbi:MAG: hypothetical protein QNJ04_06955 [Desulfobacterales bacterium]|nr:hypothetical protein [Desulfobacterales bacterium]
MKQYVVDELRYQDFEALQKYFQSHFSSSGLDGLYWIPLEADILSATQRSHTECHPHYFSVELEPGRLSCELLVRTASRVRCDCIVYADDRQRDWLIKVIDAILEKLAIHV